MSVQRGFTLLEMLVVMVLMGLVTTLALPAMQRWHDAVQHKAQAATIIDALRAAGFNAGANRREIIVDDSSFRPIGPAASASGALISQPAAAPGQATSSQDAGGESVVGSGNGVSRAKADATERLALALPAGWQTERVDDIRFLANGLCRPGSLLLRTDRGDMVRVEVHGPLCGVELAPPSSATTP